jgi:DNA-binding IclR family transcriptional regulator
MSVRDQNVHSAYSAPIVSKAMRILRMVVRSNHNPGISEIASALSLAKSTTHGILAALETSGWVLRDPITRKYTCGHAVKELGTVANVKVPLVDQARPILEKLSSDLNEDVFLGILIGKNLLILDQAESAKELKVTAKPGTRLSMFAGSAGKIFLAHLERDEIKAILRNNKLPQFTPRSVNDPERYLEQLDQVRKDGIAVDIGEYIPNCRGIAAPIFYGKKNRRRMVAGFWLVSLDWHLSPFDLDTAKKKSLAAAESISKEISIHYG